MTEFKFNELPFLVKALVIWLIAKLVLWLLMIII